MNICPPVVAHHVNNCFEQGIFPACLKQALVSHVHKKCDEHIDANFKPISVLALISKVFEKCISSRLTSFLRKFNLLSKKQFGFQKGLSTDDALIEFSEFNYDNLNNSNHVINILIDFTKAFDTVNHDILLEKMYRYGIRGVALSLFRSYLSGCSQCVKVGPCVLSVADLPVGVPQGSVLGPLLFLLYINDLPNAIEDTSVILFADDASVCLSNCNLDNLIRKTNSTLSSLSEWILLTKFQ